MAGGWNLGKFYSGAKVVGENGADGVTVTTGGAQFTKGSWQQVNSSLPQDIAGLMIQLNVFIAAGNITDYDLAVGPSGSEKLVLGDMLSYQDGPQGSRYYFPFVLPKGTRVAARCWTNYAGSDQTTIQISSWDGNFDVAATHSAVDQNGFLESHFAGTQINPGTTANTKSAWVEIAHSTPYDYKGLVMSFDMNGILPSGSIAWFSGLLDIGFGPSGSEEVVISNFPMKSATADSSGYGPTQTVNLPIAIPAGTRIAARYQSTNTTTGKNQLGLSFLNVRG